MFGNLNPSLSDKIAAARDTASDPNININSIPSAVDGSPSDQTISQPNLSGLKKAGPDIAQQQAKASQDTGPAKRAAAVPNDIQYERPGLATFPTERDPSKQVPTPQKKGFMESLIEKKAIQFLKSHTNTPEPQSGQTTNKIQDPDIQKAPDNKRVDRPQIDNWTPTDIKPKRDPSLPNQILDDMILKGGTGLEYTAPAYNPIVYNAPKIGPFKSPKLK